MAKATIHMALEKPPKVIFLCSEKLCSPAFYGQKKHEKVKNPAHGSSRFFVYLATNGHWYTFRSELMNCEECAKRLK